MNYFMSKIFVHIFSSEKFNYFCMKSKLSVRQVHSGQITCLGNWSKLCNEIYPCLGAHMHIGASNDNPIIACKV